MGPGLGLALGLGQGLGLGLALGSGLGLGLGLGCLVCRPHPPLAQPVCQCAQSLACVRWLASQAMSKKERMY